MRVIRNPQSFFGEAPKSFYSIDAYLSLLEFITVINIKMSVSAEHQLVIALPFIGIDDAAPPHFYYRFMD